MVAGDQVPGMAGLLVELVGSLGAFAFRHKGPIWAKVGITRLVMVRVALKVVAHWPADGVNV